MFLLAAPELGLLTGRRGVRTGEKEPHPPTNYQKLRDFS